MVCQPFTVTLGFVVLLVYLDQTMPHKPLVLTALSWTCVGITGAAALVRFWLSPTRRFELTTLDLIVLFIALVLPNGAELVIGFLAAACAATAAPLNAAYTEDDDPPWANMCPACYAERSTGILGTGKGQYLLRQDEVPAEVWEALERARAYWRAPQLVPTMATIAVPKPNAIGCMMYSSRAPIA